MLIRHHDGRFRTFTREDGLPQAVAFRIEEDDAGRLWITWQDVVTRYDGVRFVNFGPGDFPRGVRGRTGPSIPAGNRPPSGGAWTADGLHCLRAGEVSTCLPRDQLPAAEHHRRDDRLAWRALGSHRGAGSMRIEARGGAAI